MKLKELIMLVLIFLLVSIGNTKVFAAFDTPGPNYEMKKILKAMDQQQNRKPASEVTAEEARKQPTTADAVKEVMKQSKIEPANDDVDIEQIKVDGAAGKLSAAVYRPPGKDIKPVVVYFHGGGWVVGTNENQQEIPRSLAKKMNAIFVSVEYRKAPENKFPAAHEDAFAAYKWVLANTAMLGGDPKKIAVAGEEVGGNLALNVAIRARDEKIQLPIHQLILYPVAGNYFDSNSYKENVTTKPLNKPTMEWYFGQYLNRPDEKKDLRINLLLANFLSLNPTTIITAELDPLRSEGRDLADKMKQQNVDVNYKIYRGVTNDFMEMAPVLKDGRDAQEFAAKEMKKSFKKG